MDWNKEIMRVSLLVATLVVDISYTVSYKSNGGNINYDKVRTISIANFPVKSDYVYTPLGTRFNKDLKDISLRQTRLRPANNSADPQIDGGIAGYNQYSQAVSADGCSSETKLTIMVDVCFVNNMNHEWDFGQQSSASRAYDSRELLIAVQDGLIAEVTKEITDQILNVTVANW